MVLPESSHIVLAVAPHASELVPKPPFQDEVFGGTHPLYTASTQKNAIGSYLIVEEAQQLGFVAYEYPWDLDHTLPLQPMISRGLISTIRTFGAHRLLPEHDDETGLAIFETSFAKRQEHETRLLLASRVIGHIAEGRTHRHRDTYALAAEDSFDQEAYQTAGFELTGRSGKYAGARLLELCRSHRPAPPADDAEKEE